MKPKLLCASGNRQFEISVGREGLTIGRDASNTIRIEDPTVSSMHCHFEVEDDRLVILDSQSTNGTFVNGKAISRAILEQGDEIRIGETILYFLREEPSDVHRAPLRFEEIEDHYLVSSETVRLDPTESAYLKIVRGDDLASLQRMAHDMSVLLTLNSEINQIPDTDKLQHLVLERIFEIVPAETGVILLGSRVNDLFLGTPVSRQRFGRGEPIGLSRSITVQVFMSGVALLRNDLLSDEVVAKSIATSRVHSVLCVPLVVMTATIGVIYLATTKANTPFSEGTLQLVTAVAGIAALALEHGRYVEWLETENRRLVHEIDLRHNMIGDSPRMKQVYEAISLLAPTDSPVLILGESGTGKELAARAIHNNSSRRDAPFVVVNCAAIAESLFASEMFGYVKGAFTGADHDKKGFMEEADRGTLFLDELGELPPHNQAALLRAVEEQQITRVGATRPVSVNIRLISATNRKLEKELNTGGFRADLYYRMGLRLELPPLRERLEDIPLLVRFFLQQYRHNTPREIGATPPDTIAALQRYRWPGNVRELAGIVQWAVIFGKSDRIRPDDLPEHIWKAQDKSTTAVGSLEEAMHSFERQFILRALEETKGNVVEAATLLARAPNYLQRRISQLGLRDDLDKIRQR